MIDLYKDLGFQLNLEKPGLFSSIPTAIQSNISNAVAPQNIGAGSIVDYLQSPNFNSGITGWQVNANGDVEFNNGVFRGTLTAASGSLGAITIGTNAWHVDANGNMWWGNYATYTDALIKISATGSITFTTGNFSGALSGATGTFAGTVSAGAIISANISADLINAGTLIGRTVKATNSAGQDIWIDSSDGQIKFRYGNANKAYLYADSSGNLIIDSDNAVSIQANSYIHNTYNDDGGGDGCSWINDNTGAMALDDDNDLTVADNVYADNYYDYAEFFESTIEWKSGIEVGISVVLINDKIRPAQQGEIPFGVVSGSAAIILNGGSSDAGQSWGKKYLTDDFGQKVYEEVERWYLPRKKGEKKQKGWCDESIIPERAKIKIKRRQVLNPDYDKTKIFIPRKKRPEWNKIGLVGRVRLRKNQPTSPHWIKLKNISENVEEWLIR